MKKVKEVFREWEQFNLKKLLFDKVVVVQVPHFIDGVDVPCDHAATWGLFGLGPFFALLQIPGVERLGCGGDARRLDSQAFCHGAAQFIRRHLVDTHSDLR